MADRSPFLGRLAGVTQIVFGVLIGGVAAFGSGRGSEPEFVPRSMVLIVLFALPGVVGLIGTAARRPTLLVAAGLTSMVGAFVAFSGVTLIFLAPAILFLAGALRMARTPSIDRREGWLAGLAQLGIAAAIVALLLGAGRSALLVTDSGCWTEFRTPLGVRIERGPYTTSGIEVPAGATSVSCSTGLISARGVGLGALLAGTAVALAFVATRRRALAPTSTAAGLAGAR